MRLVADRIPVSEVVYADDGGELLGEPFTMTRFTSGAPLTAVASEQDCPGAADSFRHVSHVAAPGPHGTGPSRSRPDRPGGQRGGTAWCMESMYRDYLK